MVLWLRVSATDDTSTTTGKELHGSVMDVVRGLLGDHAATSTVLDVVAKLVERNHELELLLTKARASKHHNERVAKEQLDLFLDLSLIHI